MGLFTALFNKQPKSLKLDPSKKIHCPGTTIVYGTKTGNAQLVAQHLHKTLAQSNIESECINLSKYNIQRIFSEKLLLIVMSTDGEGELPPNSRNFYRHLNDKHFPQLPDLNYSICALGDSSYEFFCGGGRLIEERLNALGAKAALPRMDCDVDFKDSAMDWIQGIFNLLTAKSQPSAKPELKAPAINLQLHEMHRTTLLRRKTLSKGQTATATYHLELDNSSSPVEYHSGDCIELIPENPDPLVNQVIDILKIDPTRTINGSGQVIYDLLKYKYELTKLTRKVIRNYQSVCSIQALDNLINHKEKLSEYIGTKDLLDLLRDYPSAITGEQLVKLLMPLNTRYYSIASGYRAFPGQIDLTIKTIRFETAERNYEGPASVFLNEHLQQGARIHFRLVPNPSFYLPGDNSIPVIMVGVGTGIAPFRAFLQDRKAMGLKGKTWLIWGSKKEAEDFLYEEELKEYVVDGYLEQLNVCFSRDQEEKIYVQHHLARHKQMLLEWINQGAHLYLCGHTRMGHDVRDTLSDILMEGRRITKQDANSEVLKLKDTGLLHEDLY